MTTKSTEPLSDYLLGLLEEIRDAALLQGKVAYSADEIIGRYSRVQRLFHSAYPRIKDVIEVITRDVGQIRITFDGDGKPVAARVQEGGEA